MDSAAARALRQFRAGGDKINRTNAGKSARLGRGPLLDSMHEWLGSVHAKQSQKSAVAAACSYALGRWPAMLRYCDDGLLEIDNKAAERSLRAVALGRKNYTAATSLTTSGTASATSAWPSSGLPRSRRFPRTLTKKGPFFCPKNGGHHTMGVNGLTALLFCRLFDRIGLKSVIKYMGGLTIGFGGYTGRPVSIGPSRGNLE